VRGRPITFLEEERAVRAWWPVRLRAPTDRHADLRQAVPTCAQGGRLGGSSGRRHGLTRDTWSTAAGADASTLGVSHSVQQVRGAMSRGDARLHDLRPPQATRLSSAGCTRGRQRGAGPLLDFDHGHLQPRHAEHVVGGGRPSAWSPAACGGKSARRAPPASKRRGFRC
jgi:hypothetical protein